MFPFHHLFGTLAAILLSASSIPTDIENRVLSTVTTKPVQRTTIILGKIIGFIYIIGVVLIVMGGVSYALIKFTALKQSLQGNSELVAREQFDPDTLQITGESDKKDWKCFLDRRRRKRKLSMEI